VTRITDRRHATRAELCKNFWATRMQSDSRGDTLRRITKAALGGLAGCALALGGTQLAAGVIGMFSYGDNGDGDVTNLPAEGPFDDASLTLQVKKSGDGTNFVLDVTGINPTAAGKEYGAHLHTGICDPLGLNAGMAGPHYNHLVVAEGVPVADAEISRRTEVWFDLVPNVDGVARDSTTVKFVPVDPDLVMSIVIHNDATALKTGVAGARAACFPLDVSGWAEPAP
jgi:Cu/Zn superoxide dismutase